MQIQPPRGALLKKLCLEISQIHWKTPALESRLTRFRELGGGKSDGLF